MTDASDPLINRALAAYFRTGGGAQPKASAVEKHDGKKYVVLRGPKETLAVYRVRAFDGVLRRMRRWPKELDR
jgi:hypothetical protein